MYTETKAEEIPQCLIRRAAVEQDLQHAKLKAHKEASNKSRDEQNTLTCTEFLSDDVVVVWAQCMCSHGIVYSRAYKVAIASPETLVDA